MVSQVEIVSKEIIKPLNPTPYSLKHLKLSLLDRLEGLNYGSIVLFYQNQCSSRNYRPQISRQLKQSLSKTLTKFYPFAGRINGNISIDCTDAGAFFVEAQVHANLSEALIQSATATNLNQYLPLDTCQLSDPNNDSGNYVQLAVQISFFDCGGIAIGACLLHAKADAYTFAIFMDSWAAKCSGRTDDDTVQPDFQIGLDLFPPICIPEDQMAEDPSVVFDFVGGEERIVTKRFEFDSETLARMKKLVSTRSGFENPTKVEIVSAFIWKHLIDVTRAKNSTKRVFGAFHAVDLRRRISPPLLDAMGNFIVVTLAQCALDETEDYCNLIAPLRTSLRKVDNEFLNDERKRLGYLSLLTKSNPEMAYYFFTSLRNTPFYEVDYGWGKPVDVCIPTQEFKNKVTLMDSIICDGIEAWITLSKDDMEMLPIELLSLENNDFRRGNLVLPSKL